MAARLARTAAGLACMSGGVVGAFLLRRATLGRALTVFDTVYSNCIVTLATLAYYCVLKFLIGACCRARRRHRNQVMLLPRSPDGEARSVEVVWGVPRLTLENVWILVYGVGFVLFIGGYCMLGAHPLCLACFGFAVGVISVDELVSPRAAHTRPYASARCAALLAALVSLVLVGSQLMDRMLREFVQALDLYALSFGLCLPFVGQFLLVAVRECRHYTLGSVVEVCEFGLPFAVFLSIFHLSVAYGQQYQFHGRDTFGSVFRLDRPFVLYHALAPLLTAPALLAYVTCALDGRAVDALISSALALCVHFMLDGPASVLGVYGAVACGLAVAVRLAAEYRPAHPALWINGGQLGQAVKPVDEEG